MSKEDMIKTIGKSFFVWFLTLSILILSMTLVVIGVDDNLISLRIGGVIALTPLAKPMWEIFKTKGEKQDQDYKLNKLKIKEAEKPNVLKINKIIN